MTPQDTSNLVQAIIALIVVLTAAISAWTATRTNALHNKVDKLNGGDTTSNARPNAEQQNGPRTRL